CMDKPPYLCYHVKRNTVRSPQKVHGSENRLRFHYHPLPAPKRCIFDNVMFIGCPIPQVMDAKLERAIFLRPFHNTFAQRSAAYLREKGDNVDTHCTSLSW